MSRTIIFIFLIILSLSLYSQSSTPSDSCYYISNGQGASLSIKLKMYYPCSCKEMDIEERDNIVKAFKDENTNIFAVLTILDIGNSSTNNTDYIMSEKGTTNLEIDGSKVISKRKIIIDELQAVELISTKSEERAVGFVYHKTVTYYVNYLNKLIGISYAVADFDLQHVTDFFNEKLFAFRIFASKTVIFNQWKSSKKENPICNFTIEKATDIQNEKINISVPCEWKEELNTTAIKTYNDELNQMSFNLRLSKLASNISQNDIDAILTKNGLSQISKSMGGGNIINPKKVKISNLNGIQFVFERGEKINTNFFNYRDLVTILFSNNKMFTISYSVHGIISKQEILKLFNNNLTYFQSSTSKFSLN